MGRTSIDGLSARPSGAKKQKKTTVAQKTENRTVGTEIFDDVKKPKKPPVAGNDFLSPVQGFGAEEPDDSLGVVDDSDWSDLLNNLDAENAEELGLGDKKKLDDASDKKEGEKGKKSKKNKKGKKKHKRLALKIILGIFLLLAIVFFIWGDWIISKLTGGRSGMWDALSSLISENVPFETDANGRTNVLVFGTEGYNMNVDVGNTQHDGAQLTDSIMVISFDQETKDVALLSLPRDLRVSSACYAGKVNEIFTCNNPDGNNEDAGAEAMMEEIGDVLGIDFQYWAHVNWGSLVSIIDTLGGITITLDEDINDYYFTGVRGKAGEPIHVDGETALGFARARHGTTGGDFTRGNTQQKIVEGIVQKIVNDGIGITEAFNIINILGDNLRSNFSTDNMKTGVSFVSEFDMANIRNVPLVDYENNIYYVTTDSIGGISYVVPAAGMDLKGYVAQMFSSNPAVREGSTIAVFNGTETAGVAGNEQTRLENDHYQVSSIGDAPAGSCGEKYCVYMLDDSKTATKAALEERYGVGVRGAGELPTGVWAGDASFVVIIGQADGE